MMLMSVDYFNYINHSEWRKKCFKIRHKMILDPCCNFLIVLIVGFVTMIPAFISVIIIHSKFKSMLTDNMKDDHL